PTAIGWLHEEKEEFGFSQHDAWETMMRSHAIANGTFVAAVNRVGIEDGIEFWGQSFVADPTGAVLSRANKESEETLIVECNLDAIDLTRTHWPFLRDRRIEAYQDITKRYID
ncbi:MAG: nitrilase-related carbon-nitrogen hydrolase, partial [Planctomycetota bacterium]